MWQQRNGPPNGPSQFPLIAMPEELAMSGGDAIELLCRAVMAPPGAPITKNISSTQEAFDVSGPMRSSQQGSEPGAEPLFPHQAVNGQEKLLGSQQLLQLAQEVLLLWQRLQELQPKLLLALLLAHQGRLGQHSFWHCYISNLPAEPPCAWVEQTTARLANQQQLRPRRRRRPLGSQTGSHITAAGDTQGLAVSSSTLETAAAAMAAECAAAADVFGAALGGLTPVEVAWAYAQVESRAFTAPAMKGIALMPVIDMLNHAAGGESSAEVACWPGSNRRDVEHWVLEGASVAEAFHRAGSTGRYWTLWLPDRPHVETSGGIRCLLSSTAGSGGGREAGTVPIEGGEGSDDEVIVRRGEELCIEYMSDIDAVTALLRFGFIPPELQNA